MSFGTNGVMAGKASGFRSGPYGRRRSRRHADVRFTPDCVAKVVLRRG
jgi:hypothetical protein